MVIQKNRDDSFREEKDFETQLSEIKMEMEEILAALEEEKNQRQFYQFVADFTFGWELWLDPSGKIKYCSPSCQDLTGFTANQVIASENISVLLIYEPDREKFNHFISDSLDQLIMNQSLEFRILTRHKQLCWCSVNVRGVYNKQGRYLGIRASVHDITRLKRALGHIQELSEGKEFENRAKWRMKSKLDNKEREVISSLLQLSQKNELLALVQKQLKKIVSGTSQQAHQKASALLKTLESVSISPVDWEMVVQQLENLHPGFIDRLKLKHPNLSSKEEKLCSYLRLGLSSKEIAGLQNINSKSVEVSRGRLRKKLKLQREERLKEYVDHI
ncbi:PAS domain S-box protein [Maribellus maritimus]|uniref:PAS domain S-box protein n=1 Tax=Maribellus maritimus TaxID=2870838 RepID=UPI001EEC7EF2|nr:PAS domain S-box protein [Maribellus maritimus]MCG6185765.1 PAS domain S-box protein [Maribellus maritimus]